MADGALRERIGARKTPEDRILELIRVMSYWIRAEEKLESYREGAFYIPENKKKNKETAVTFNKVVRDIISGGQYTRKSELISDV